MKLTLFLAGKTVPLNTLYSGKLHWAARSRLANLVHAEVVALVREVYAEPPQFTQPVTITATCYAVRPPDPDGIALVSKLVTDGLVLAGVLSNDSYQHVAEVVLRSRKADAEHPPGVLVEISSEEH